VATKTDKLWGKCGKKHQFPVTALREINTLLKCKHENIVAVQEMLVGDDPDEIFLAMEFVEHDMKTFVKSYSRPGVVDIIPDVLPRSTASSYVLGMKPTLENWCGVYAVNRDSICAWSHSQDHVRARGCEQRWTCLLSLGAGPLVRSLTVTEQPQARFAVG
jgi:serine/threonine protein kinase